MEFTAFRITVLKLNIGIVSVEFNDKKYLN